MVRKPFSSRSGVGLDGEIGSESTGKLSSNSNTSSPVRRRSDFVTRMVRLGRKAGASSGVTDELQVLERMDTVRAAFVAFAKASSSGSNDAPVCVAWYNDGSTELLSEESLSKLGGYYNWRASITGLQAYVRPKQSGTGVYSRCDNSPGFRTRHSSRGQRPTGLRRAAPDHGSTRGVGLSARPGSFLGGVSIPSPEVLDENSTIAEQENVSALDCATTDIAFVADMSYALPYAKRSPRSHVDETFRSKSSPSFPSTSTSDQSQKPVLIGGKANAARLPWPHSRVRIARLEAGFIIDELGCTWFSHAIRTLVQPVARTAVRKEQRGINRQARREETRLAASVAARELRALVQMASRRGLTAEEAFEHFDPDKQGRVGKIEIRKGMASLGVALSDEAAVEVVEMVIACANEQQRRAKCDPSAPTRQAPSAREPSGNCNAGAVSKEVEVGKRGSDRANRKVAAEKSTNLRQSITAADLWFLSRTLEDVTPNDATDKVDEESEGENASLEHNQMGTGSDRDNIKFHTENQEIQNASKRRRIGDAITAHPPSTPPSNGQAKPDLDIEPAMSSQSKTSSSPSRRGLTCGRMKTGRDSAVNDHPTLRPNRTSSGGMGGTKVSSRRSLCDDKPELASFPCADPVMEAASGKERVFHVDR